MTAGARRSAGVCLHISSLPGRWGIGDIGAGARRFIEWMQAAGLGVWQFLPLGPTGIGDSPYQLLSIHAGNPLFIDLAGLAELGLLTHNELAAHPHLPDDRVDYGAVIEIRRSLLAAAASRLDAHGLESLRDEYAAFLAENDACWLHEFALYSALKAHHGGAGWDDWREVYRLRDEGALRRVEQSERRAIEQTKRIQFLFFKQWEALRTYAAGCGVTLFGDLPIYMALDCAEAWARPDLLDLDADGRPVELAGVPPDYFSADGQHWGCPLYRWDRHEAAGFAWWIDRLSRALEAVDVVRLDHFRGFEEYWAIPTGAATAREGQWRPGPGARFFDAVQEALGSVPIVAEDLGIITEAVTALRRAYGIPGMQVLQFLVDREDFDLAVIEEDCVCYTGTHDNDTTVGWFESADGEQQPDARARWQQRVMRNSGSSGSSGEDIHKRMIELAFSSRARMAVAPMQDYLGLGTQARLNRPGHTGEQWRWRLDAAALDDRAYEDIRAMIVRSGREQ